MSKKTKTDKSISLTHDDILGDFFIVNIVNKRDSALNDIAGIFRTQEMLGKFLANQRVFMHAKHEDVFHSFPDEWSFIVDKYVGYVMQPDEMVVIPLKSLMPAKE